MTSLTDLAASLRPLVRRVRRDVTAIKGEGGAQRWTRELLNAERLHQHLNGGPARGVSQIPAGTSSTMVAVLDFDSHGGETPWREMVRVAMDVAECLRLMGGEPIAWRSSGGKGIHLYLIWDEPQDAYSVRDWLKAALAGSGLKSGAKGVAAGEVEVFPKQDSVPAPVTLPDGTVKTSFGNQVVLPLAGASVPLLFDDLVGEWVVGSREDALAVGWLPSEPVPLASRPERAARVAGGVTGYVELQKLLQAIPNRGRDALDYDEWWRVVAAIHHETNGSPEGLELAHEFSSRSEKYSAEFLDERVWPFIRSDGRAAVIGLGSLQRIAVRFGWVSVPVSADVFDVIEDERPPLPARDACDHGVPYRYACEVCDRHDPLAQAAAQAPLLPDLTTKTAQDATLGAGAVLTTRAMDRVPTPMVKRRGIPEAHHLTTDQANANRLVKAFGRLVFVAAGRWHVWDGKRWLADEADVYRYGCQLSDIIKGEATEVIARAAVLDDAERAKAAAIAEALKKWAVRSEMKATIESAIGLARKMLTVDADLLDRDPFALNVANGIVDLRTGRLRAHNPDELITKLVPVAYREGAPCEGWERALGEIARGDEALLGFLQRWFGYCLTGSVDEQAFVVHWGGGANGKSTVLGLMADTLGDYAGVAAPGLLAATKGSERHPTEIAALMGRRMVTAHESGEGVVLREDFVKQATGGDRLEARFMRGDFFGFTPTHKLQLLTNHKPAIKGQDKGIWRRVLLVPYLASFGDVVAVREGRATGLAEPGLLERLRGELEGILAWRVRGAVAWAAAGLQAPAVVREASEAYKAEQDRVGQFVRECCELAPVEVSRRAVETGGRVQRAGEVASGGWPAEWLAPLTDGMGGLYPAYVSWCKEGGTFALSKVRFADDMLRVTGAAGTLDRQTSAENGRRRKLACVPGVRLLPD